MTTHALLDSDLALPFGARGPLTEDLLDLLTDSDRDASHFATSAQLAISATSDVMRDDDLQLALFVLYSLHYGALPQLPADREWDPSLIAARTVIESAFEAQLRDEVVLPTPMPAPVQDEVARALFSMTAPTPGPSLSRFVAKQASLEQLREFLIQRSAYTLREADPHSWAIPRLHGRAKAALVEIQADEYGSGDPRRVHAAIFAQTMRGLGLSDTYGAYIDAIPALTLASLNMMSMFGLNRRLRGAIVGHLAAFEMTSSLPNRSYAEGFRRHGFGHDVTWYFDEHVEADAVHEQIAGRDMAAALAEDEPDLLEDIIFGAAACLAVDGWAGEAMLDAFKAERTSLRKPFALAGGAVDDA